MHSFHIRYRNTQGTLMRILNAASRRALDLSAVHAEPVGIDHAVTLLLEVTPKQAGQLQREWYAIADVLEVVSQAGSHSVITDVAGAAEWAIPHPPSSAGTPGDDGRAIRA